MLFEESLIKCKIAENTYDYKVEKNLNHKYMYAIKHTIIFLIMFLFVTISYYKYYWFHYGVIIDTDTFICGRRSYL